MLRGIWVLAVLLVATPLCGIPSILINLLAPRGHAVAHAARLWSRVMLAAAGVRVEYEGLERIDPERPYVFIANHQSSVDIWVLMRALPPRMRFAAKEELRRVPVIGWALSASGSIFIDRADRRRAIGSLRQAAERIRQGASVVLFAEGTRSLDGALQPFKKGPFHVALHAAVPVVPIAISGSWSVMRPGSVRVHPGVVRVRLLEPIEVGPWLPDGVDELRRHVHGAVRAALEPAAS
jgi:1-acyl-sn-glycerol-3-phosphate acyltransferase